MTGRRAGETPPAAARGRALTIYSVQSSSKPIGARHQVTVRVTIDRILIDAHTMGTARTAMRYRGESADRFSARRRALREEILGRRVTIRWAIDVEGSKLAESNERSRTVSCGQDR